MDANAVQMVVTNFSSIASGYRAWATKRIAEIKEGGEKNPSQRFMQTWEVCLADCDNESVLSVLDDLESGKLDMPMYGDAPRSIAKEARNRMGEQQAERRREYAEDRGVRCLACKDIGELVAYNPSFVQYFRPEFERRDAANDWATGWLSKATKDWIAQGGSGCIRAAVVCNCEAPHAVKQRQRIRNGEKRYGVIWNPSAMPKVRNLDRPILTPAQYDCSDGVARQRACEVIATKPEAWRMIEDLREHYEANELPPMPDFGGYYDESEAKL